MYSPMQAFIHKNGELICCSDDAKHV